MRRHEIYVIWGGVMVALAVMGIAGYVVALLAPVDPLVIAGIFTGMAVLLAAVPPIIRALRGQP
ncbi:hypothetical protein ACFYY8_17775 [Streptosporangium sp. NPDC001559]|uniref:hypothetical protein n=1 Tax=Streptosporangium sp. NPDC001559 TaxID=3366187 RepID=UPI0036ED8C55